MSLAARSLTHRSWRRRHLVGLMLIGAVLFWSLLWGVTAYHFNHALTTWIDAAKGDGIQVTYSARHTNGSPFAIHIHLDNLSVTAQHDNSLQATESVFYLSLWNWRDVSMKLRKGVSGVFAQTPFAADSLKLGFAVPTQASADHDETGLALWLHPQHLVFKPVKPLPFGNTIEEARVDFRIMGAVPNVFDPAALKAWNEAGGVVEFDRVFLVWDKMVLTGSGTMGLDPDLQPEGAFSGQIDGFDEAIATLEAKHLINKRQKSLLASSLNVLARPTGLMGKAMPIVPVSIQGGAIYVGPVKLFTLPPLVL